MKRVLLLLFTLIFVVALVAGKARSSRDVKKDKEHTATEIKETTRKIEINTKETARQINQLNLLSAEIKEQSDSISQLRHSIDSINGSIVGLNDSITVLNGKLKLLRDRYGEMLRSVRAQRHSMSDLAFIFSSKSFTEAYRRVRYLNQFSQWKDAKVAEIKESMALLDKQKKRLEQLSVAKNASVTKLNAVRKQLLVKEKETSVLVDDLKKEKSGLDAYLKQKQEEAAALDQELDRLIAEEQRIAEQKRQEEQRRKKEEEQRLKEEQRKQQEELAIEQKKKQEQEKNKSKSKQEKNKSTDNATAGKKSSSKNDKDVAVNNKPVKQAESTIFDSEAEAVAKLTGSFESNKGKLPFPVSGKYKIVRGFGRQHHPDLPYVEIDNSGIDIEVPTGIAARAIFDGKVSAIFQQPGYNMIVMVRHGEYLTIYANLGNILVKPGDTVKANQSIGIIYSDPDDNNRSILHFEIRKEKTKLNPQSWVK